ncbi:MAG: nucleoside hydrolase [candidate division NC10 bacterium]
MRKQPIFLDVDTGVDDALAIILALRSPEFSLQGISTVSGNVSLAQATANTLTVLDILDAPPIPVAAGAAAPLFGPVITAGEVHGDDGLGDVTRAFPPTRRRAAEDAAGLLLEAIRRFPEELTLIATAPLTNLALAIRRDPETMRRLRKLIVMGGAIRVPGNVGPVSEFNFAADPEAAAIVLGAGLSLTLVPLDVTERVTLTRRLVEESSRGGALQTFIRQRTVATVAFHREALAVAEKQLYDLECPPETRPTTKEVMKARAIAIENRTAFKLHWKMAIERGLVENVQSILEECADYFCDAGDHGADFVAVAKTRLGKANTLQRQEFTLLLIKYLHRSGSFHCEETKLFDDSDDTAGGCDEITQDAAMYLIKNPDWKPAA